MWQDCDQRPQHPWDFICCLVFSWFVFKINLGAQRFHFSFTDPCMNFLFSWSDPAEPMSKTPLISTTIISLTLQGGKSRLHVFFRSWEKLWMFHVHIKTWTTALILFSKTFSTSGRLQLWWGMLKTISVSRDISIVQNCPHVGEHCEFTEIKIKISVQKL